MKLMAESQMEERARSLNQLTCGLHVVGRFNYADCSVRALADDSRGVEPGTVFVAITGEKVEGHNFVHEAVRRGACALVCERKPEPLPGCPVVLVADSRRALSSMADAFYGSPSRELTAVGVTGTDGKTSTTRILAAIFEAGGTSAGVLGTIDYQLGSRVVSSSLTTPGAPALHGMLREMVDEGVGAVCMEVSSHAIALHRTTHVQFDAALLTDVTEDHLDFHKTLEDYVAAKQLLFEQLSPGAFADDPFALRYAAGLGLRYTTPVGPVAFDYGFNLDRRKSRDEPFGAFHFSIGVF